MASTETRARGRIRKALENDGHFVVTLHGDATSGRGRSDLVVCAGGLFFWLEVKTLDGSPSPAQLRRIREVRHTGGTACLITSIREARWVIDARQKGYVPYMADEPGVNVLDLSAFRRVEVAPDPDAIPFPDPPKPVPDHIVPETGEIIEPVADAELDSMLAVVSSRITAQQSAGPPPAAPPVSADPPGAATLPEDAPKRKRRTRAEIEAAEQQMPLPEPPNQIASAPPQEVPSMMFNHVEHGSDEGPTLQSIHDTLLAMWDAVSRIDATLTAEMALLEKLIAEGGAT